MKTDAKIRFVGGPWHNRIVHVQLRDRIMVHDPKPLELVEIWKLAEGPSKRDIIKTECYTLHKYVSDRGARYLQYIHESLTFDNPLNFGESFAPFEIDERALLLRLATAMRWRRR